MSSGSHWKRVQQEDDDDDDNDQDESKMMNNGQPIKGAMPAANEERNSNPIAETVKSDTT